MSPRSKSENAKVREETQSKIERSAVALFARRGLSVTIGEIAREAGVSQGLLYQYYKSKDDLVAGLIQKAVLLSNEGLRVAVEAECPAIQKINLISEMMLGMLQNPQSEGTNMFLFMIQAGMNADKGMLEKNGAAMAGKPVEYLVQIIKDGQAEGSIKSGDPASLALFYWAAVQGLCCFSLAGMAMPSEAIILSKIVLN